MCSRAMVRWTDGSPTNSTKAESSGRIRRKNVIGHLLKRRKTFHQVAECSDFLSKSLVLLSIVLSVCSLIQNVNCDELLSAPGARGHFTHTWAVHIPGEEQVANLVAEEHGFTNLGKIFDGYYHFEHRHVSKRSISPSQYHQNRLEEDVRVHWSLQQRAKLRQKRDFKPLKIINSVPLNDPKWPEMWYLNRGNGLDMNVIPAWKEGVTGKGVVVTILDDGLESDHPDLEHNYDPKASYDVNGHDDDPMPHYDMTDSNRHGTRCAGEVAATANNSKCAVGIAFGARVGGVRMLDGDVTDVVEARSLGLNSQHIDIYSASWGPDDDGKTVDGPGELATRAFIEGVTKGRAGKGSIFIWASGNGGREHDNCNCDGYTNSIWTLSISSASQEGLVPWFSEMCSSTLATTYSSGSASEKQVVTTDLHHSCTISHTGTSASAPLAAGIVALVLEANRNLTWRDLQHIVVRTAKPGNLKDPTWVKNGVGRRVSHSFGYGLMDASAMVRLARTWQTVPEQQKCEIHAPHLDRQIPPRSKIILQVTVQHCKGVNYLEHVQAKITLTSQRRGDIQIYLTSPAGTRVTLLTSRIHDVSRSGFNQWPFMSVHTWGEAPHGNWQLEIYNEGRYIAQITQWDLIFYGTETPSQHDDPPRYAKPGFSDNGFGGEVEHNSLDFESGTASGQWRNMQQVGESHVDVQRTASNDVTSSSCISFSSNNCIACHPLAYLFNGRCYSSCPESTFTVTTRETDDDTKLQQQQPQNGNGNDQTLSLSLRSVSEGNKTNFNNSNDILIPPQERDVQPKTPQKLLCASCHSTCLKCIGSSDYDCTDCPNEYILINDTHYPNRKYCLALPSSNSSIRTNKTFGNYFHFTNSQSNNLVILIVFAATLSTLFSCVGIYFLWKRCFNDDPAHNYEYNLVNTTDELSIKSYVQLVKESKGIDEFLNESSSEFEEDAS